MAVTPRSMTDSVDIASHAIGVLYDVSVADHSVGRPKRGFEKQQKQNTCGPSLHAAEL